MIKVRTCIRALSRLWIRSEEIKSFLVFLILRPVCQVAPQRVRNAPGSGPRVVAAVVSSTFFATAAKGEYSIVCSVIGIIVSGC